MRWALYCMMRPSSEIIRTATSKIIDVFEDVVQTELIRVRWEEIKKLQPQFNLKSP